MSHRTADANKESPNPKSSIEADMVWILRLSRHMQAAIKLFYDTATCQDDCISWHKSANHKNSNQEKQYHIWPKIWFDPKHWSTMIGDDIMFPHGRLYSPLLTILLHANELGSFPLASGNHNCNMHSWNAHGQNDYKLTLVSIEPVRISAFDTSHQY